MLRLIKMSAKHTYHWVFKVMSTAENLGQNISYWNPCIGKGARLQTISTATSRISSFTLVTWEYFIHLCPLGKTYLYHHFSDKKRSEYMKYIGFLFPFHGYLPQFPRWILKSRNPRFCLSQSALNMHSLRAGHGCRPMVNLEYLSAHCWDYRTNSCHWCSLDSSLQNWNYGVQDSSILCKTFLSHSSPN